MFTNDAKTYFLYARKSSESEDRQVQSIDDQVRTLTELADKHGKKISKVYTEAKSAKQPDNRPVFKQMIQGIERGEADGIMCWQINRLSRNPVDSGHIQWMLQQGKIKSLQTIEKEYRPEDNVLLFSVESGSANQFILDLSKNVKRGNQSKLMKGWRPGMAPIGYLNNLSDHTIIADPERFPVIKKIWNLMLTGDYAVSSLLKTLNDDWGFRTAKKRRSGGKPLSLGGLYAMFTSPFYMGTIIHGGQSYPGKHEIMVTPEEFDQVQVILGRKGKRRPKKHNFAFTGIIRCGQCGCAVTAETKTKFIKQSGETKDYTYYHCTKQKVGISCSQPSIDLDSLEKQIDSQLAPMTILPEFKDWALEVLNSNNDGEIEERSKVYETQHSTLVESQKQLDNLTKMRYRDLIGDDEFLRERNILQAEINHLKENLRTTEKRAEDWLDITQKAFNFAASARHIFQDTNVETKRTILRTIGFECSLKDRKLSIKPEKWLEPILENYPALELQYRTLEPKKLAHTKAKTEVLTSVIADWQARSESDRRRRFWRPL